MTDAAIEPRPTFDGSGPERGGNPAGTTPGPRFEPDTLLPAQWFHTFAGDATIVPERRLLLAILEEAVATFQRHVLDRRRRGSRLFREAEAWLLSDDVGWPCSFLNICDALGLEVGYLRRGLLAWRDARRANPGPVLWRRSPFRRLGGSRTRTVGRPVGSGRRARPDGERYDCPTGGWQREHQ